MKIAIAAHAYIHMIMRTRLSERLIMVQPQEVAMESLITPYDWHQPKSSNHSYSSPTSTRHKKGKR
jgi:hypothetical protein